MVGSSFEARRHQLDKLLDPWGPSEVMWVKDHCLIKAQKVYLNYYDLLQPHSNWILSLLGLGGAFHAGIELFEQEYAFGGHYSEEYGIFSGKPLFQQRVDLEDQVHDCTDASEQNEIMDQLTTIPKLHSRLVVGWWRGSQTKFDELLRMMKEQKHWKAPTYRLLSRNCNHFVQELCQQLLDHECFHALPGCTSVADLVPQRLTRLTEFVLCCCPSFLSESVDTPMLHAPYELDIFQGKAQKLGNPTGLDMPAAVARTLLGQERTALLSRNPLQRPELPAQRRSALAAAGGLDTGQLSFQPLQLHGGSSSGAMGFGNAKISITPSQRLARSSIHTEPTAPQSRSWQFEQSASSRHGIIAAVEVAREQSLAAGAGQIEAGRPRKSRSIFNTEEVHASEADGNASTPFAVATPQQTAERISHALSTPSPHYTSPSDTSPCFSTRQAHSAGELTSIRYSNSLQNPDSESATTRLPRRTSLPPLHRKGLQHMLSDGHQEADHITGPSTPQGLLPTQPQVMERSDRDTASDRVQRKHGEGAGGGAAAGKVVVEASAVGEHRMSSVMAKVMETLQDVTAAPAAFKRPPAGQQGSTAHYGRLGGGEAPTYSAAATPRTPPATDFTR